MAARRPRLAKLDVGQPGHEPVVALLGCQWSPQQIAAWCGWSAPANRSCGVQETIYKAIYVQGRGELREELKNAPADRPGLQAYSLQPPLES